MLTGQVYWTLPKGSAFSGVSPLPPQPINPPDPSQCINSVGGIDGTLYQDDKDWKETCPMFADQP